MEDNEYLKYLKKEIRAIQRYLGPIMNYEDEGYKSIPSLYWPQAAWIYSHLLDLKELYYYELSKLPVVVMDEKKRRKRKRKKLKN